jgi:hypothetical protein
MRFFKISVIVILYFITPCYADDLNSDQIKVFVVKGNQIHSKGSSKAGQIEVTINYPNHCDKVIIYQCNPRNCVSKSLKYLRGKKSDKLRIYKRNITSKRSDFSIVLPKGPVILYAINTKNQKRNPKPKKVNVSSGQYEFVIN